MTFYHGDSCEARKAFFSEMPDSELLEFTVDLTRMVSDMQISLAIIHEIRRQRAPETMDAALYRLGMKE